jgi:hypothetical protein
MAGKRFALYTLDENSGRRAQAILGRNVEDLSFALNHDKVGTARLKALAEGVDYFLVVTGKAKHAATEYIDQHLPADKVPVYVNGKGSSAILRTLLELGGAGG